MNINRKGFTLVELLAVILILGVVLTIAIMAFYNVNRETNERREEYQEEVIFDAARLYLLENPEREAELELTDITVVPTIQVSFDTLITGGYLTRNVLRHYPDNNPGELWVQIRNDATNPGGMNLEFLIIIR